MPTENRSSNTELQQIEAAGAAITQIRTMLGREQRPDHVAAALEACDWSDTPIGNKAIILSAIQALRATQHQGEPVAHALAEKVREALDRQACPNAWMVIAYEAVVQNYTHADPAEVERLRSELEQRNREKSARQALSISLIDEARNLRAQLAEAHALLREIASIPGDSINYHATHMSRIARAALPASAEPSAPVERCEESRFRAWWSSGDHSGSLPWTAAWDAWQARAALERKP